MAGLRSRFWDNPPLPEVLNDSKNVEKIASNFRKGNLKIQHWMPAITIQE